MVTMFLATYKRPGEAIFTFFFQKTLKILRRYFYSKKSQNWKNWTTGMLCTSNESWEHVQFIFRYKKDDFQRKKKFFLKFFIFWKFWKNSFSWKILKFSKKFQKWPLQDFSNIARNKVTKNQPIWGIQRRLTYDNRQGGGQFDPPPCKIGLRASQQWIRPIIHSTSSGTIHQNGFK